MSPLSPISIPKTQTSQSTATSPASMAEVADEVIEMAENARVVDDTKLSENFTSASVTPDTESTYDKIEGIVTRASDADIENSMEVSLEIDSRGLRFAPPEVREMIFSHLFQNESIRFPTIYGEVPALLKALLGDRQLFQEALAIYYKDCIFAGFWARDDSGMMGDKSSSILRQLRSLCVFCREEGGNSPLSTPTSIHRIMSEAVNVEYLDIEFPLQRTNVEPETEIPHGYSRVPESNERVPQDEKHVIEKAVTCIKSFGKLKAIRMVIDKDKYWNFGPGVENWKGMDDECGPHEAYKPWPEPMQYISCCLGNPEEYFNATADSKEPTFSSLWLANSGEVLGWTEGLEPYPHSMDDPFINPTLQTIERDD